MRTASLHMVLSTSAVFGLMAAALGESVILRRDTVVPIRFSDELSVKRSRVGDRVYATVDDDRSLPYGTWFEGRVRRIQKPSDRRTGYVDIEFVSIELPNRERKTVHAVPVRLDDRYLRRDREGRFVLKRTEVDRDKIVMGGLIGGLLLGKTLDKPFEGAVVGAIAGILVAESQQQEADKGVFVRKNQRMGALITRDVRFQYDGRRNSWQDRPQSREDRGGFRRWEDERFGPRPELEGPNEGRWPAPEVAVGGTYLRFERGVEPYWQGRTCMVPIEAASRQLRWDCEAFSGRNRVYLGGPNGSLILEHSSQNCRLNGREIILPAAVTRREGTLYAPAEALSLISGRETTVDGTKVSISAL